ncbi:MAG: hypothetical protein IJF10_00945, partial [Clostridia bacterium]|nr:hypothetical protein [Clostridia bacterium]
FRSPSVEDAFQMLGRVFTQMDFGKQCLANTVALLNISSADVALLVVCFAVLLLLNKFTSETVQRDFVCLQQKTAYWQRVWVYIYFILAVAFGWLMLLGSGNVSGFVYFQF